MGHRVVTWLTREDIDEIVAAMSAADMIAAVGDGEKLQGAAMAGAAFDAAAARIGKSNGTPATANVALADFQYLTEAIGGSVNVGTPKSNRPKR